MRLKSVQLCSTALIALLWSASATAQVSGPAQTPVPPPASADVDAKTDPEAEIVVTGLRRSIQTSQNIKRNSEGVVDVIVAEDIGKLPDITASAALARLPGIQVTRAAGEAAGVQVRGLPDVSTTYNGREIFTAEGRFVAIQDFPAGSVAALEVYKSSTANLIEGGIGGLVNVRSRRPFDFKGFEAFGALNGIYTEQADKFAGNGNFLISNRWDTGIGEIGLLVNAAYTRIKHLDSTREQSLVIGPDFDRRAAVPFRYPDAQALFYGAGDRWRPSATATLQWKPTPELEIYLDGLFQGFRSRDTNRFLFVPLFGNLSFRDVVVQDNGLAQSFTASGAVRPEGFTNSFQAKTNTYQGAAGATYSKDRLRVSADVAYTNSRFSFTNYSLDFAFASSPDRQVNFDVRGGAGGPAFNFVNFDATNPANFIYRGLYEEALDASGKDTQARADLEYETGFPVLTRVQFGVRYDDRRADRQFGNRYQPGEDRRLPLTSLPLNFEQVPAGFIYDDIQPFRRYAQPTSGSIRDNIAALRTNAGFAAGRVPYNPLEAFVANEKAYTGYAQLKYEFDIGGTVIDGLVGLRAIKTKTSISGTARNARPGAAGQPEVVTFDPIARSNEYTDYLPNFSARIAFQNNLQARLAYTQTRTRPGFFDLNPSGSVSPPSGACVASADNPTNGPGSPNCFRNFSGGNPDLRPLTSTNYDATLEYYFARAGSATISLFRRDVNGFISRAETERIDPEFGRLRSNIPLNGGNGRLQGVEVAFSTFFDYDFLPEWARAFGVQANYTYIDAKAELNPDLARGLPGRQRLTGVSKHAYNLVALYEKPKYSARLAYNYRSNFVDSYGRIFDPGLDPAGPTRDGPVGPIIQEGLPRLDFSATYTPIPNVTIAFDVNNITGDPIKRYRAFDATGRTFPRQVIYLERVFSLGVRFRI